MSLRTRIGFDVGTAKLEDALEFATTHSFHYLDFNCDTGPNHLDNWSEERTHAVLAICQRNNIRLSLHTSSGVNVAELSPFVSEALISIYVVISSSHGFWIAMEWLCTEDTILVPNWRSANRLPSND